MKPTNAGTRKTALNEHKRIPNNEKIGLIFKFMTP